jgi:hypothetical protein
MQATAGGARMTTAVGTWEETVAEMGGPGGGIYQDYLAIDGSVLQVENLSPYVTHDAVQQKTPLSL